MAINRPDNLVSVFEDDLGPAGEHKNDGPLPRDNFYGKIGAIK